MTPSQPHNIPTVTPNPQPNLGRMTIEEMGKLLVHKQKQILSDLALTIHLNEKTTCEQETQEIAS